MHLDFFIRHDSDFWVRLGDLSDFIHGAIDVFHGDEVGICGQSCALHLNKKSRFYAHLWVGCTVSE